MTWVFFRDFDCKFQNTYFPEHLSSGCFCRGIFRTFSRWSFFCEYNDGLKPLTIFTKKLHLRCFTRFCVRLCSEVTSSIYQTYKFKVYCNSFWRHCNVFDVVFARINETLCPLSDVTLSKYLSFCVIVCLLQIQKQSFIHVSKEYIKGLSYLGVEYYSSHESKFWEKLIKLTE